MLAGLLRLVEALRYGLEAPPQCFLPLQSTPFMRHSSSDSEHSSQSILEHVPDDLQLKRFIKSGHETSRDLLLAEALLARGPAFVTLVEGH